MIYWDNNATTPLAPEVLEAMLPYLRENFYNPSAAYGAAKSVRKAIDHAREQVAALVGAAASEIIFTSGGTEASNTALAQFRHVLTLATEHPATLRTARGEAAPVRSLAAAAHEAGARVHVDLVQAAGKLPIALHDYAVDFASLSAHKLHGPKGVGALYVRTATECSPYLTGGAQEDYRRAGTENVAGIIGFGKAAELALAAAETYRVLSSLRERFVAALTTAGIEVCINGAAAPRLPHVLNMRVPGVSAESLSLLLEPAGLLCSTGSACTSSEPHPSHVLLAMGLPDKQVRESLRFSLSRYTTAEEVDAAAAIFIQAWRKVRSVQSTITGPVMVYR